jgi:hypothetical protein
MENDFFERGLTRMHRPQGKEMVKRTEPLAIIRQCDLLDLPHSTFYRAPKPISEADLELMRLIDGCHMELAFYDSRRMFG